MIYMKTYSKRIDKLKKLFDEAEYIIIGAGAGLSTAAGIDYGPERFEKYFKDFKEKYDMTDLYTSSFYPFKTEEEKWAYWSKHIYLNNTGMQKTELYEKLYNLIKDKNHFVITTNVDDQFIKSGFEPYKVFAIQGSYAYMQCSKACHDKIYEDKQIVEEMINNIDENLKIPKQLVPYCPVCGKEFEVNIRKDNYFVEDEHWHNQNKAYNKFIKEADSHKTLLLEFGVGYNTPSLIRFPFETYTFKNKTWNLARFNKSNLEIAVEYHKTLKLLPPEILDQYQLPNNFNKRYIPFTEDINNIIDDLTKIRNI